MRIESVYELCEAVCDFHDMMQRDRNLNQMKVEQFDLEWAKARKTMLDNLLEDFSDLVEFSKRYVEQNGETL